MIGFLNECGRLWYEPFGLMVVQNTLFLGIVFAALYWLRHASARARYGVAILGVVKLITPPFIPAVTPQSPAYLDLAALARAPYQPLAIPGVAERAPASITPAGILVAVWLLAAAGVIVHTVVATLRLRHALAGAEDAGDDVSLRFAGETGVRVCVSARVPVPMTIGVLPATIYVPPQYCAWAPSGRRAVLQHELAHIHRHDGVVRALETVVRALYWFHPLVALLVQRIDVYREQDCDERAAAPDPEGRLAYSQQLVEIAEHLLRRPGVRGSASALLRRRNELLGRVHYLTREETSMKLNKARAAALTVALVVALTSLSWYHSTATPQAKKAGAKNPAMVELLVAGDGTAAINGHKVKLKEIGVVLQKKIDDKNAVIHIECEKDVPMSQLFAVHEILREAGMYKVSYAGLSGEDMPLILPSKELIEKSKQIAAENLLELQVQGGGKCVLAGVKVDRETLPDQVKKRIQQNAELVVSLTMAKDATYGDYLKTLKVLKLAKAERIFINEPSSL